MPLIILTGLPLSSKTTRSKELFKLFTSEIKTVIISEETLSLNKTNLNEKEDRQKILSKVERELSKDVLVIVDHLNYIKGFRYQVFNHLEGIH